MTVSSYITIKVLTHFNIMLQLKQGEKIMLLYHEVVNYSGAETLLVVLKHKTIILSILLHAVLLRFNIDITITNLLSEQSTMGSARKYNYFLMHLCSMCFVIFKSFAES